MGGRSVQWEGGVCSGREECAVGGRSVQWEGGVCSGSGLIREELLLSLLQLAWGAL